MTETKIKQTLKTPNGEKILDDFANNSIQIINEALADKDKKISELERELAQWRTAYAKLNQPLTNRELLKELAERIVAGQLKLEKPDLIERYPGKTAEEIVECLENPRNLYNKDGYPFCDIREIYDEKTNSNPLGLYYFIAKVKNNLEEAKTSLQKDKKEKDNSLTKIQGILTSNLRTRTSTDVPYMAFFRLEYNEYLDRHWRCKNKHGLPECIAEKCQECEIPVVFRIENEYPGLLEISLVVDKNDSPLGKWHKPTLKKGDKVILEGKFSQSKDSNRPSFTCYSYQILKDYE